MTPTPPPKRPNILLIMSDQFRFPRYSYGQGSGYLAPINDILGFQGAVDEENPYKKFFPGLWALRRNSVVLRNHTIASSACIPSRAAIMTGQYGTRTGVTQTDGLFKSGDAVAFPWLPPTGVPTIGSWLREAGYATHYFGKWHVSNPPEHSLKRYGFDDWELSYPEPHGSLVNNLGVYRDFGFADLACGFLRRTGLALDYAREDALRDLNAPRKAPVPKVQRPWFAVASFANPHDIATYPGLPRTMMPAGNAPPLGPLHIPPKTARANPPLPGLMQPPLNPLDFPQDCATPAANQNDPLTNKPWCQLDYSYKMGLALAAKIGLNASDQSGVDPVKAAMLSGIPFQLTANPDQGALAFLQYYVYLHQVVDQHIARVLLALEDSGQRDNTIVVFLSDHGEYGASHGMLMEKWHTGYQEALHVPVVVSSPLINPDSTTMRQVDALTSHIDILPTLLGLSETPKQELERVVEQLRLTNTVPLPVGVDLTPVIKGTATDVVEPNGQPREGVLFITDDAITEPLPNEGDPHQVHSDAEFGVFLKAVEGLVDGTVKGPFNKVPAGLTPGPVRQPNHVRLVRTQQWKLVRYLDPHGKETDQWELYDLKADPNEMTNLVVFNTPSPTVIPADQLPAGTNRQALQVEADSLAQLLARYEQEKLSPWP